MMRLSSLLSDSHHKPYMHFLLTGVTGVFLNMFITWSLTEFVFGVDRYLIGYLVGATVNVLYNFTLHSILTFKTKRHHRERFVFFVLYSILSAVIQIAIVNILTGYFGHEYYLLIIAGTILFLSIVSYVFFKHSLFNEGTKDVETPTEDLRNVRLRLKEIATRGFTFASKETHVIIIIIALAMITRLPFLSYPDRTLFDEAIYTNYTILTINQVPFFDIHPPLARMIFAKIAGNSNETFTVIPMKTDESFGNFPYIALRTLIAIFGVILPLVIYAIGRRIGYSPIIALLPSLFIIFDNALVLYSRTILPDMLLLVANFTGLLFTLIAVTAKKRRMQVGAVFLAGMFLGAAISIKWTALAFLAVAIFLFLKRRMLSSAFMLLGLAFFVYVGVFFLNFSLFTKGGPIQPFMPAYDIAWINSTTYPHGNNTRAILSFIPKFHQKMFLSNSDPIIMTQIMSAPGPLTWPLARATIRFWENISSGKNITLTGNSILWFATAFVILFEIGWIIFSWIQYRRWTTDESETLLVIAYFANYLPFFFIERAMFLYHYFSSLIILFILLPKIVPRIIHCVNILARDKYIGYVIVIMICIFSLINFISLAPTTYGF